MAHLHQARRRCCHDALPVYDALLLQVEANEEFLPVK